MEKWLTFEGLVAVKRATEKLQQKRLLKQQKDFNDLLFKAKYQPVANKLSLKIN